MELHNKQKHNGFLELTLQFSVPILLQKFIQLLNNKVHHTAVHSDISFLSLSNFRKATQHSGLGGQCSLCVSVLLNLNKSICLCFTTRPCSALLYSVPWCSSQWLVTLQLDYVLKLAADQEEGGKLNLVRWFAFLHFVLSSYNPVRSSALTTALPHPAQCSHPAATRPVAYLCLLVRGSTDHHCLISAPFLPY